MSLTPVSIKLPPYWPSDPQLWFVQAEAQFALRGINVQKTMFDYVVACLSPEFATEVRELLIRPPDEAPYDKLKALLIKRTTASEQKRFQQLLNTEELGDRTPTQLLRKMHQLLGDKALDESFLRELFLQRLPTPVRMVLAATAETTSLDELATMADRIMEAQSRDTSISAVNSPPASEISQLREEIERLKQLLNSKQDNARPRRTSRGRSPSPTRSQPLPNVCWYHQRFGDTARKCRPPCSKSGNAPASH